jgi:NOL1/NOP2/fmu family ribosome biogenesis protein
LRFLKKEQVEFPGAPNGWTLVRYQGLNLGWVKIMDRRTNNYYPKEWRILMEV